MMTDTQIYELRPDLKALNEEYVEIGQKLPALGTQISEASDALLAAQQTARADTNLAIEAVQKAKQALKLVEARSRSTSQQAESALTQLQSQQRQLTERRSEVQRLHNAGIDAAQAEFALRQETELETITAVDVGTLELQTAPAE